MSHNSFGLFGIAPSLLELKLSQTVLVLNLTPGTKLELYQTGPNLQTLNPLDSTLLCKAKVPYGIDPDIAGWIDVNLQDRLMS